MAEQISWRRYQMDPSRDVRKDLGTGCRLSKEATQGSGSPSSLPSRTSVGIPLIVRVTGATRILFRTGIASLRVTTSTGCR